MAAQYVLGIDLGTTNSVLAYSRIDGEKPAVELLTIPQLVAPGTVENRTGLPSFLYLATEAESRGGAYDVNGQKDRDFAVGEVARKQSAELPMRTISQAKSWLGHSRVDRHHKILPWNAPAEIPKISPVTASRRFLEHLAAVWENSHPEAPVSEQLVVLTVPASFDASARELTREAALAAGLPDTLILLEEPQAAVYAWLHQMGDRWRKSLKVNDRLLVCDIGGGTTDFTLVGVTEERGDLILERMAVGNHLLVGGDNMDLALAFHVAGLFAEKGIKLDPWQSVSLWHSCRAAKEALLTKNPPKTHPISILGRGSKLIGGTVTVEVEQKTVADLLLNGFFPKCDIQAKPVKQRASGFQDIGLPYESDTAVTKHLAAFLQAHGDASGPVRPTHLLLNGGAFKSEALTARLREAMGQWFGAEALPKPLDGIPDLDHSVAKGAAAYGWAKNRGGVRIRGGTASAYYVGIETSGLAIPGAPRPLRGLCVVPVGMEEGTESDVPSQEIGLVVGEPATFRFFRSAIRKDDQPGTVLPGCEELEETDPMTATLPADEGIEEPYVPVKFHSKITELGLLELWCVSTRSNGRWKLEFSVREDAEA